MTDCPSSSWGGGISLRGCYKELCRSCTKLINSGTSGTVVMGGGVEDDDDTKNLVLAHVSSLDMVLLNGRNVNML